MIITKQQNISEMKYIKYETPLSFYNKELNQERFRLAIFIGDVANGIGEDENNTMRITQCEARTVNSAHRMKPS